MRGKQSLALSFFLFEKCQKLQKVSVHTSDTIKTASLSKDAAVFPPLALFFLFLLFLLRGGGGGPCGGKLKSCCMVTGEGGGGGSLPWPPPPQAQHQDSKMRYRMKKARKRQAK